jgi:hypothetical protein
MNRFFVWFDCLTFLFIASLCCAAEVIIPLPVVTPETPFTTQVIPFEIDISINQISRIDLRLQGTYDDQLFICDVPYHTMTAPGRVKITLGDDVLVEPEVQIIHSFPANPGDPLPFNFTETLLAGDGASWAFLADGNSQLGITDHARILYYEDYYPCGPVEVFGTITSGALIVTFDPGVPSEVSSWGSLKRNYHSILP